MSDDERDDFCPPVSVTELLYGTRDHAATHAMTENEKATWENYKGRWREEGRGGAGVSREFPGG